MCVCVCVCDLLKYLKLENPFRELKCNTHTMYLFAQYSYLLALFFSLLVQRENVDVFLCLASLPTIQPNYLLSLSLTLHFEASSGEKKKIEIDVDFVVVMDSDTKIFVGCG